MAFHSLLTSGSLFGVCRPCACSHSLCEFICVSVLLCLEDSFLGVFQPLQLLLSFCSLFGSLSPWGSLLFDEEIPCRAEGCKVSCSLRTDRLWVSLYFLSMAEEASQARAELSPDPAWPLGSQVESVSPAWPLGSQVESTAHCLSNGMGTD